MRDHLYPPEPNYPHEPPPPRRRKRRKSLLLSFLGFGFAAAVVVFIAASAAAGYMLWKTSQDLPDYESLAKYEPPVMTRIHAHNGALIAEYARERRIFVPINTIPKRVIAAFLSAEDRRFYEHGGVDFQGIARAVFKVVESKIQGNDKRAEGGSTITQQVAKNFLLSSERSMERKLKEAILAIRIERAYSKDKILELYLNEIYFGIGAYGIAAASLSYFDKELQDLSIEQVAYLAALPKGPNNYHPFRREKQALIRRNWIIGQMQENGYITEEEAETAKTKPLGVNLRQTGAHIFAADYFAEEVRRTLLTQFGEEKLYNGGLSVRTTLDPRLQQAARRSLMDGLVQFDRTKGWRGPVTKLDISGDWGKLLDAVERPPDIQPWRLGVVLKVEAGKATVGLRPEKQQDGSLVDKREAVEIAFEEMKWAKSAKKGPPKARDRRRQPGRRDLRGAEGCRERRRRVVADADPGGRRRHRRARSQHRSRARRGRRLLVRHEPVRPRHPGQAPARLLVQAVRLRRGARQRLQADLDHSRRADRNRAGTRPGYLEAGELREGALGRSVDAALRHRAFAQPDDGAPRPRPRHADHHRLRQALRHLRRSAARAVDVARRRRDDAAAHRHRLLHDRQRRPPGARHADRPHSGSLGPHGVAPRPARLRRLQGRCAGTTRKSRRFPTTACRSWTRTPPIR